MALEAAVELAEAGAEGRVDPDDRRLAQDPRRDPGHFGRRRFDAALLVPGATSDVADPTPTAPGGSFTVAADPETALRQQPPKIEVDLDEPLYDERDARRALERFRGIDYDQEVEVAPGIHATFVDAGHILGSAIIRLRVADREGGPEVRIVFSGDLGRRDTPILRDPTVVTEADYVLVESTYGGREHEPGAEATRILAETVRLVADHDGVLLVPSFAIGRTQEVVWELDRLVVGREDPAPPALPRLADGLEGERRLPGPPRLLRCRDAPTSSPTRSRRSTTRTRSSRTTSATRRRSLGRRGRT